MKKSIFANFIVSTIGVSLFILGNSAVNYISRANSTELLPYKLILSIIIPIILGVVISYPLPNGNRGTFDWIKFLIQGFPALILAIPLQYAIFALMQVMDIGNIDFGAFNKVIVLQSQNLVFHAAFGVWFGKVLVESFGSSKQEKKD